MQGTPGVLSLSTFSAEAGSLTESRAHSLARLAGHQFPRILPSLSINTEIVGLCIAFYLGAGNLNSDLYNYVVS